MVGINPTPTLAECCNHLDNPLITKVLHTSTIETWFIPVLLTADKIKSKCTAAARVGINPTPTLMYAAITYFGVKPAYDYFH